MGSGIWILSAGRRRSATSRALALTLGVITVFSGGLSGALPVGARTSAPADHDSAHRTGRLNALAPVFVPPTADAGDDQSVTEGNVVTLDATRSKSSNLVTRTYTTSADFAEGTSINLTDTPPDQLRLDDTTEAFGFIWIAASNRGTVVKIDTATGVVLGEYWSAPQNHAKDPSRTTVDHNGNVWVGNRAEGSPVGGVVKGSVTQIGLAENGQCVDRNGNGVIDTSTGLGNIRAWPNSSGVDSNGGVETAADECVINFVRTDGVNIRQVSVDADNHVWVGGAALGGQPTFFDRLAPNGTIVRSINMRLPAQTGEPGIVNCCYGGLVDPNGILWSSADNNNYLVRIDPSKPNGHADLMRVIPLGVTSYGMGIDPDGNIWQSNWVYHTVKKINPAGAILGTFPTGGFNTRGVAVTQDGDVWVANSGSASVSHLRNNGTLVAIIPVGVEPTGVAVDAAGKVWASNLGSSTASRINPATNTVDLTVSLGAGANPYNYSDMTGSTLTGAPDDGTWSTVYDSGSVDTAWAFLDWAAQLSGDASFTVTVASSANGTTFGPEVAVTAGEEISGLANGRYLRVTARFTRSTAGESPVLFDLTIAHAGDRANTLAYQWRLVDIDGPPVFLSSATSPTPSFVAPDDASYTFELTVTDSAGLSDTDEVTVAVTNLNPAVHAEIGSAFARGVTLVNASFTDPGWLDVHAASFNWGDGTAVQPMAVTAQGTGWGSFFGSHVYAAAGSYHVTVTLTDDDGGSAVVDLGQVSVAEPVAVWANSQTAAKTFDWTGGGGTITGRVHSNREVKIAGTLPKSIIGPTEYVTTITVTGPHTVTPVKSTVQPYPITYNLADYAPGGKVAIQVGAAYFNHTANCVKGLWDVGSQVLPVGVHYAPCSIKVNGTSIGGRITMAATGSIELSGSRPAFEPFHDGLLLLAGASGAKAINVSASSSKFLGILYAGAGEVSLSGSNSKFFCGIYGNTVSASGSNLILRGSNCGRPDSTISGPLLVPGLELSLAADPDTTLPGGDIAYDLQVSNSGSLLIVPGLIGLENVDTAPATVTGITYAFEYFSVATGTWVPIASLADGKVVLEPHANPSTGVTYPAPDQIVGTVVGAGGFATWGYQALVDLTPAQVNLLLDPTRVTGFRNRVEFTLNPSTVQVRRLFTFGTDFIGAIRALSGNITDPTVTFLPPAGDLVVATGATIPALATLTPGETVALDESFTVPVPAPRSPQETDAGYLARLLVLDGSALIGSSFALAQGGVGRLVAPLVSASTTEQLPVVSIATTGPDSMPAGTTAQFNLGLANQGSAAAPDVNVTATAAGDPLTVSGAPASLAAGQLASATTTYSAPLNNPPADVTVAGSVAWSDAAGNDYGPVGSSDKAQILTAATLSALLVDTLQTDVGHDGQVSPGDTVRYTITISNHGGQPLTGVNASITPDPNSGLVVGSVAAPGGTVQSGNGAGNTSVVVLYASVPASSNVSFTFDVTVDNPFPTGVSGLEVAGHVSATGFDPISTDDPSLFGLANPTKTTVVVPVPNLIASLSGQLHLDPDGNGFPSAGDTLRYELVVASVGSLTVNGIGVIVPTPTGTTLVPGSVTTSVGTVNGGTNASVNVGSLPFLAAATIRFDLSINSPLAVGMTAVTAQGTVASNELADLLTDDPHTVALADATVITVGAGSGGGGGGVPGVPGPAIGTVSPAEGTVITEPIDISAALTPPAGETVTAWTVSYHLEGDSQRTEIASGSGNNVAATIDPTVMPNGAYVIEVRAEGSAGGVSIAETSIVVDGQLKLGRYVTTYQDLAVGVAGLPMQVLRKYDSFDKSVGDFGVGWTLELAQFQVATNGPLGQGGWRMFGCGPGLIFVPLCFESAGPHYVAVTWPDGRVETFDLTPAQGSSFLPGLTSAKFTARPRTTSTLEAVDSSLYYSNGDLLGGFFGSDGIYDPTRFRLTDKFGTTYLLDRALGLISATDRNGNTLTITPNGVISSLGPSITFTRDGLGRITKVVGPASETITYGYDAAGDLTSFTSPLEDTFTYSYDDNHNLEISRDPQNRPFRTISYDAAGRMESITDGVGNTTLLDVSLGDRRQIITDPTLELTTIVYQDESGDVVRTDQIFDGRTITTRATYDDLNRKRTETDALGGVTRYDWDAKGNLTYVEDQEGRGTTMTYDAFGLPKTIKTHDGTTVLSLFYDDAGNLERQESADGTTTRYTWEGGRLRTVADDFGHTSLMEYTPEGWISELTTADGQARSFTYDESGRTLTVTEPGGAVSTFTYDGAGNVLTAKDPTNNVRRYTYDAFDRLKTETDYADKTTTYAYDTAGRLERRTDRNGQVVQYTYDAAGRVASKTLPGGVVTAYDYDPLGRPVDLSGPNGRIQYGYDDGNRLVSQRTSGAGGASQPTVVLGFGYDDAGVQTSANGPLGPVAYSYDEKLRLDGITAPAGAFGLTYDDHDRLTGLTRPNGVTDVLTYKPTGQLESRVSRLGATVLTSAAYTYGQGFLRTSLTDLAGVHAFTFDGFGRITSATHPAGSGIANESFTYNNSGNRTSWTGSPAPSTTYEYGRLTGDGRYTYEYDFEGNLVERTRRSTGAVTTFHWNAEHQLLSVDHPGGSTSTYRYDPVGRRIEVNDNGSIRRYAYDGPNVVAEYNGSNTLVRAYLTTDAAGEVLASRQGANWHYYSVDGLGSVTAITDGTGAVERRLAYDSFGALQGTPSDETYSFAGHQFDAATGLYQARARYYDPTVGRFISEDPIPSLNSYAYAANDPVNLVDTNGCQVMAERGLLEKIRAGIGRVVLEELAVAICQELVETALLGFGGGPNLLGSAAEDVLGDALGPQAHPQVGLGNRRPDWRLGFFDFFESKNTKSLALTRQLRETAQLVLDRGGQYFIVTRASTAMNGLSGPLRRFVASTPGVFIIGCLPG